MSAPAPLGGEPATSPEEEVFRERLHLADLWLRERVLDGMAEARRNALLQAQAALRLAAGSATRLEGLPLDDARRSAAALARRTYARALAGHLAGVTSCPCCGAARWVPDALSDARPSTYRQDLVFECHAHIRLEVDPDGRRELRIMAMCPRALTMGLGALLDEVADAADISLADARLLDGRPM